MAAIADRVRLVDELTPSPGATADPDDDSLALDRGDKAGELRHHAQELGEPVHRDRARNFASPWQIHGSSARPPPHA